MALEGEGEGEGEGGGGAEIHGDILETIFSHVPLIHLASASRVSKSWCHAVSSSLRHRNPPKPWLVIRTQTTRHPYAAATTTTRAYDPRSELWLEASHPPIEQTSDLKSSQSSRILYMLTPSRFSFSIDALGAAWCHVAPPRVWRRDPIVARVGDKLVVAGGGCDFEDDPLAVEIYDLNARAWSACDSMPLNLKDSSAAWLSVASTREKLVAADKQSGVAHFFYPDTGSWSGPFFLDPGEHVSCYNIGFCSDDDLIMVGVLRSGHVERVKIWSVDERGGGFEEIGEMPLEFVRKLKGDEGFGSCSVDIRVAGNMVYVFNASDAEEVVACEVMEGGGGCRWWSTRNVVPREGRIVERVVFWCSEVGVEELRATMMVHNWTFKESSARV